MALDVIAALGLGDDADAVLRGVEAAISGAARPPDNLDVWLAGQGSPASCVDGALSGTTLADIQERDGCLPADAIPACADVLFHDSSVDFESLLQHPASCVEGALSGTTLVEDDVKSCSGLHEDPASCGSGLHGNPASGVAAVSETTLVDDHVQSCSGLHGYPASCVVEKGAVETAVGPVPWFAQAVAHTAERLSATRS